MAVAISVNHGCDPVILSAVGATDMSSGKLLMLNQCLCLKSSTMANPFGEALFPIIHQNGLILRAKTDQN